MSLLERVKEHLVPAGVKASPIREVMASIVVFLVALPLCIAIASACQLPPTLGLITGIIGGIVVGWIAGSPLQVSGPAAGLVVLVVEFVQDYSVAALGFAVLLAGVIQLAAGMLRFGRWFRATSPAVIRGMLAGIGVLILSNQFHVMVDDAPRQGGLANLVSIPESIWKAVGPYDPGPTAMPGAETPPVEAPPLEEPVVPRSATAVGSAVSQGAKAPPPPSGKKPKSAIQHKTAAALGVLTILIVGLWNRFRPEALKFIPGALLAVLTCAGLAWGLAMDVDYVSIPDNPIDDINWIRWSDITMVTDTQYLVDVLAIALIASAETLLCATAVDRLHDGPRTHYDKELFAQGVGNVLSGLFGALPMTGVIVRSSANVDAGAKTRFSAILHGFWLLVFIAAIPWVLAYVPQACLAGILVYIGWKLMNLGQIRTLWNESRRELLIFLITVTTIVVTDLLTGVVLGLLVAGGVLLWTFSRLDIIEKSDGTSDVDLYIAGAGTFLSLPRLAARLEELPKGSTVNLHIGEMSFIDPSIAELIENFAANHTAGGGTVTIDWGRVKQKRDHDVVFSSARPRSPGPAPKRSAGPGSEG